MKLLKETEVGGNIIKDNQSLFGCFDFPKIGETSKKIKTSTFEGILQIPFKIQTEEVISPALDTKGKSKGDIKPPRVCGLSVDLPFDSYGGRGIVTFNAFGYSDSPIDEETLGKVLLQALGNEIFSYKLPLKKD